MRLYVLVVFVTVAAWNFVVTDGACYNQVSSSIRVTRYRYEVEKYYYRTFIFGWIRKSAYRRKRVAYYVLTTVYRNKEIPCPVNGGWSNWRPGKCSVTCGNGFIQLTRQCNNPRPANGGRYCVGTHWYVKHCNKGCCPVHGGWSSWIRELCSKTCGGGLRNVTRECINPRPSCGGNNCSGSVFRQEKCNNHICCPVDGVWSKWIDLSKCTKECGGGAKEQFRSCDNPKPSCGGRHCTGATKQMISCNSQCCPVNGGWSDWEDAADAKCSQSCGTGFKTQVRSCTNPVPECGGETCEGADNRMVTCNEQCCPVDGGWSEWEDISECTASCGTSLKEQNRTCDNPPPSCGGLPCIGNDHRITLCNTTCCPVDGGWSDWQEQSECSASCGGGMITKNRTCTNPSPSCGGSDCEGDNITDFPCNTHCCPVDGGWSDWNIGNCSVACGGGVKEKFRLCNNPAPSCGGKECSGMKVESVECNEFSCDGEEVFSSGSGDGWGEYSECSVSCGNGTRYRTRKCIGDCKNVTTIEYEECNMGCCPVDGGWTEWEYSYQCTASCGKGVETFHRSCTNPQPACGGKMCDGSDTLTKDCDTQITCPPEVS